jgi:hypothetical protein
MFSVVDSWRRVIMMYVMSNAKLSPAADAQMSKGMYGEVLRLARLVGVDIRIEDDVDAPMQFSLWAVDRFADAGEMGELVGSGEALSEAIDDARVTLRGWQS